MPSDETEVLVMGGGPAGSSAATFLRQKGHEVVLLERETFPRFMIGESLLPAAWGLWNRLGITERVEACGYPVKRGVLFRLAHEGGFDEFEIRTDEFPKYFERPYTFHVDRASFDKILLDTAREHGADVREGCTVQDVLFEGTRAAGARYVDAAGKTHEVRAKAIVDATGRRTVLAEKLRLRKANPKLKKVAYYGHFDNAGRVDAADGSTMTRIHGTDGGWIWYIPLRDGVASVGVVLDASYVQGHTGSPRDFFDRAVARDELISGWLSEATESFPLKHVPSISYLADSFVGDGFVMAGDAAMFIDPIFSAGVMLAMRSGDFAADAISDALKAGDVSAAALAPYEAKLRKPMDKMHRIIANWYDIMSSKDRAHLFSRSAKAPLLKERLVVLLSGGYDKVDMDALLGAQANEPAQAASAAL